MGKTVKKFDDGLQIAYFEFSKDIVCVEVNQYGKNLGAFCSDVSYFQEWDENDLLQLTKTHIKQVKATQRPDDTNRKQVGEYEIEYATHFDDMVCINVYKDKEHLNAFCSDRQSFEEWLEEDSVLEEVVKSQVQ